MPRLDSKMNPGRSSRRMVVWCWPSELWMWISASFRDVRDQLPTTRRIGPGLERMGIEFTLLRTAALARCSFSKNSPRFSEVLIRQLVLWFGEN